MNRIIIEEPEFPTDGTRRSFHLTVQVSGQEGVCYRKYPSFSGHFGSQILEFDRLADVMGTPEEEMSDSISMEELSEAAGEVGHALAQKIMEIEGVLGVVLSPFQVDVDKGAAFDWEIISPAIKRLLLEVYNAQGITDVSQEIRRPDDWEETPQGRASRVQNQLFGEYLELLKKQDDWKNED